MTSQETAGGAWSALAVRLAAVWILAGAGFKLFEGTPADLPPIVRELPASFGVELGMTYKLAITIELVVAFLALLRPRWAWIPLSLIYVAFLLVLSTIMGEESCGCFGSRITLAPVTMLGIDGALLLAVLASRPWARLRRGGPNVVFLTAAAAVAVALPWAFDREAPQAINGDVVPDDAWLELDIENWVGRDIWDTPLAQHLDVAQLPLDGLWVLYRNTCDHCATHLAELAETELGDRPVTLVRLMEPTDTEANRVVFAMPSHGLVQHAELPDTITYILTTPGDMVLEGGRIVSATEGAR